MLRSHTTMLTSTLTQRSDAGRENEDAVTLWMRHRSRRPLKQRTSSLCSLDCVVMDYRPEPAASLGVGHHAGDLRWWAVCLQRRDSSAERQRQKFVVKVNGALCTLITCKQLWANVHRNIDSINTTVYPCTFMGVSPSALYNRQNILLNSDSDCHKLQHLHITVEAVFDLSFYATHWRQTNVKGPIWCKAERFLTIICVSILYQSSFTSFACSTFLSPSKRVKGTKKHQKAKTDGFSRRL